MENLQVRKKPSFSFSHFGTQKYANSTKTPKSFERGMVGLGIVAAMSYGEYEYDVFWLTKSTLMPIPILSSAKPATNFPMPNKEKAEFGHYSNSKAEDYTCVISHSPNHTIKKHFYFDDCLHANPIPITTAAHIPYLTYDVLSASPVHIGNNCTEFWTANFLEFCNLCNKQLHGADIFIYRGERAFCSAECREGYIRSMKNSHKEKLRSSTLIKSLDCSISSCSSPTTSFAGIVTT